MKNLSDTCAVVQALAASSEPMTVAQLNEVVDLPKPIINSILPRLIQQGRVKKNEKLGRGKYKYSYIEESQYRSIRGNQPGRRPERKPLWMVVERGQEKVDLLKKVLLITDDRKDLVASMLKDYGVESCSEYQSAAPEKELARPRGSSSKRSSDSGSAEALTSFITATSRAIDKHMK